MPGTQTTVGPTHEEVVASQPKTFEEWWDRSGLNRLFVKPVGDLLDYTGQVARGEVSPMGLEGHATPEALNATTSAAGLIPMSGLAGRMEEGILAANAGGFADKYPTLAKYAAPGQVDDLEALKTSLLQQGTKKVDSLEAELQKMLDSLSDPNFFKPAVPDSPKAYEPEPFSAEDLYAEELSALGAEGDPTPDWMKAAQVPWLTGDMKADTILAKIKADPTTGLSPEENVALGKTNWWENDEALSIVKAWEMSGGKPPAPDPLAPKPLDTEKYPWLAKPATPEYAGSGILDKFDPAFGAVRNELYRRGMPQDPINEIQHAIHSGTDEGLQRAEQLSQELRALLPEDWNYAEGNRYSTVVPHAIDQVHSGVRDYAPEWYGLSPQQKLDLTNKRLEDRMNALISKAEPEALQRAQEQEYDLNLPLYRSTRSPTDQFMDPSLKQEERGMFFADRPGITTGYGRYTYPVYTRAKNPYVVDFAGKDYGATGKGPWSSGDVNKHIELAREAGHDMAILRNLRDDDPSALSKRSTQDQYVIFDPSLIRSPLAKFDPNRMNENNLLAAQGVGINPFPSQNYDTQLTPEEEQQFQAWKAVNAPQDSGVDYDLRGAYKAGLVPAENGHWADTFKKPNEPTFSTESQYFGDAPLSAGHWTGPNHDIFSPPPSMVRPEFAPRKPLQIELTLEGWKRVHGL